MRVDCELLSEGLQTIANRLYIHNYIVRDLDRCLQPLRYVDSEIRMQEMQAQLNCVLERIRDGLESVHKSENLFSWAKRRPAEQTERLDSRGLGLSLSTS